MINLKMLDMWQKNHDIITFFQCLRLTMRCTLYIELERILKIQSHFFPKSNVHFSQFRIIAADIIPKFHSIWFSNGHQLLAFIFCRLIFSNCWSERTLKMLINKRNDVFSLWIRHNFDWLTMFKYCVYNTNIHSTIEFQAYTY